MHVSSFNGQYSIEVPIYDVCNLIVILVLPVLSHRHIITFHCRQIQKQAVLMVPETWYDVIDNERYFRKW